MRRSEILITRSSPAQDLRKLMPSTLPQGKRFETREDTRMAWGAIQKRLGVPKAAFISEAIQKIDACVAGGSICNCPLCPRCARRYRGWFGSEALALLLGESAWFVTIYGEEVPQGTLTMQHLIRFHGRLRQQIRRHGRVGMPIVGGTEISWRADRSSWLVHVHLLVIGATRGDIALLRTGFPRKSAGGGPSFVARRIYDEPPVASYAQKFALVHRPGQRTGSTRPKARLLPEGPAREMARLLIESDFTDFLFLSGCRRRGSKIVPAGVTT